MGLALQTGSVGLGFKDCVNCIQTRIVLVNLNVNRDSLRGQTSGAPVRTGSKEEASSLLTPPTGVTGGLNCSLLPLSRHRDPQTSATVDQCALLQTHCAAPGGDRPINNGRINSVVM